MRLPRLLIGLSAPLLVFVLGVAVGRWPISTVGPDVNKGNVPVITDEPLLIVSQQDQKTYSILPSGAILTHEQGSAEGYQTYRLYLNIDGEFKSREYTGKTPSAIWARSIDSSEIMKFMQDYPLSLQELRQVIKAQKLSREEYIQILREWEQPNDDKNISQDRR